MKLYVVQHGEAVEKEVNPDRPLSPKGRKDVEAIAKFLGNAGVQAEKVWHSGKPRAQETAEILAAQIAPQATLERHAGLDPKDEPSAIVGEIQRCSENLLVVGHLPHLERLVAHLLTQKEKSLPVSFERGGVVGIEREDDQTWRIRWMIVPSLLPPSRFRR